MKWEKRKKTGQIFPCLQYTYIVCDMENTFHFCRVFYQLCIESVFWTLIKTSYVYFFNRRTDMYLKSLNRASSLAKAIAERKTVSQLGKKLWIIILWNVLTIFNNKWNVLKVFATFKVSVLPKGTSVACIYYSKTWYQLYIMGIWFHNIFTKKLLLTLILFIIILLKIKIVYEKGNCFVET